MSLTISKAAAEFLLARLPAGVPSIRLTTQKKPGCGDVAHKFEQSPVRTADDTLVEERGLYLLCNFYEHPEYEDALIDLQRSAPGATSLERIVVIPNGATLCGCGETARLPEAKK